MTRRADFPSRSAELGEPVVGDAWGQMLRYTSIQISAGWTGPLTEAYELADGSLLVDDARRYFSSYDEWPDCEVWGVQEAQGKVLDIGAGAGKHSMHLQRGGFHVTAIDSSPGAVQLMRERGVQDARSFNVFSDDPSTAGLDTRFDTLLLLGNNLGLLGTLERAASGLRELAELAAPSALLVGELGQPIQIPHEQAPRSTQGELLRLRFMSVSTPWFWFLLSDPDEFLEHVELGDVWTLDGVRHGEASSLILLRRASR